MKRAKALLLKREFHEFALGGGLVALVGFGLLFVFVHTLGMHEIVAFSLQLGITLVLNYLITHYILVHRGEHQGGQHFQQMLRFIATRAGTVLASLLLFTILMTWRWGIAYQELLANIPCLMLSVFINYYTSKKIVFRSLKGATS